MAATLYDHHISHIMWPQAKTNTAVLPVMRSSFVSKQPPAQRLEEIERAELLWSLDGVGGWMEG